MLAVETIRQVEHRQDTQRDIRYFLSSCNDPAEVQIQGIRSHWAIENRLHWVLDMTFREDECRIRDRHASRCFAVMRKISLNLIRQDPNPRNSLKAKRKKSGWSNDYMASIIFSSFHA